jgi:hypothetical protein
MAAPTTLTLTLIDGTTTVALTIPTQLTAEQFFASLLANKYVVGPTGTFYPSVNILKGVPS